MTDIDDSIEVNPVPVPEEAEDAEVFEATLEKDGVTHTASGGTAQEAKNQVKEQYLEFEEQRLDNVPEDDESDPMEQGLPEVNEE